MSTVRRYKQTSDFAQRLITPLLIHYTDVLVIHGQLGKIFLSTSYSQVSFTTSISLALRLANVNLPPNVPPQTLRQFYQLITNFSVSSTTLLLFFSLKRENKRRLIHAVLSQIKVTWKHLSGFLACFFGSYLRLVRLRHLWVTSNVQFSSSKQEICQPTIALLSDKSLCWQCSGLQF